MSALSYLLVPASRPEWPEKAESRRGCPGRSRYSSTEVDRALVAVAIEDGSTKRAAKLLAEQGESIGETTLRDWKNRLYPDRYLELQVKVLPRLNALAAEHHAAIATQASSLNVKILDRLGDVYDQIPARDLPGAARNAETVAGIATDKAAFLRGQGTEPATPTRSVSDILNALRAKGFDPSKLTLSRPSRLRAQTKLSRARLRSSSQRYSGGTHPLIPA
jgi:hypothetical protein